MVSYGAGWRGVGQGGILVLSKWGRVASYGAGWLLSMGQGGEVL